MHTVILTRRILGVVGTGGQEEEKKENNLYLMRQLVETVSQQPKVSTAE